MTNRSRGPFLVVAVGVALAIVAACATPPSPTVTTARRGLSSHDPKVKPLLARMTLEEKIGQMTQAEAGREFVGHEMDIETYALGSLLSGGNGDPYVWYSYQVTCRPAVF